MLDAQRRFHFASLRTQIIGMAGGALACVSGGAAAALNVWVQPSGDSFATAYALQGEARTYFGRTECDTCGTLEYSWQFSDGTSSGFTDVSNPRYIEYTGKTFATFGTHWAKLTVRDKADTANSASAQVNLEVIAASSDTLNRQKSSAVDRGLRYMYQQEQSSGNASYWPGSGSPYGSTGMALVAFENHGHNLQAPDSDIYKASVQRGVQYLLNNASLVNINEQKCIGDPEADDGDSDNDGMGVLFGDDDLYTASIAVLAIVNSADQAYAQAYAASTSNDVNGMSLFDITVDAKDWLAWAQNDGNSGSGGVSLRCSTPGGGYIGLNLADPTVTDVGGYFYANPVANVGGCGGTFHIDWGDGTTTDYVDKQTYCYGTDAYPELSYNDGNSPTHAYTADGTYTVSYTYEAGGILTEMCSVDVPVTNVSGGGSTSCTAADAAQGAGGWRYSSNYGSSDNSVTQWPVLALAEAQNRWGIGVNPKVFDMLGLWLDFSQCSNGSFGYDYPESWCNFPKTAAGLIMLKETGKAETDTAVTGALGFLDANWDTSGYDYNFNNLYSMYALYKAMKIWGMGDLNGRDWEQEYTENLVAYQQAGGYWNDAGSWEDANFATYSAVAILAPEVATLPPVANAGGPYPAIAAGQVLQLVGSNSYHQNSAQRIVRWDWDFDAQDGLWWSTKAAPAVGEGAVGVNPTVSYPDAGHDETYTLTLRVTDDSTPTPLTDMDTATVEVTSGNVPPVPVTNGPWSSLPNTPIQFDASGSYDPNDPAHCSGASCLGDSIVMYEWDLDGDGQYNEANGDDGSPVTADRKIVQKSFANPISLPAKLRVTDSKGASAESSDTLNVVSIALVYGQEYDICFRQRINRFESRMGVVIRFKNEGTATAENTAMTLTSTPANLTILKSAANLGDMDPQEEGFTGCDATAMSADIELKLDSRIPATGSWTWRAEFGYQGNHYTVNGIPPLR